MRTKRQAQLQKRLVRILALVLALLLVGGFIAGLVLFLQRWRKVCFLPAEQELPREARFRTAFRNPGLVLLILLFLALTAITFLD